MGFTGIRPDRRGAGLYPVRQGRHQLRAGLHQRAGGKYAAAPQFSDVACCGSTINQLAGQVDQCSVGPFEFAGPIADTVAVPDNLAYLQPGVGAAGEDDEVMPTRAEILGDAAAQRSAAAGQDDSHTAHPSRHLRRPRTLTSCCDTPKFCQSSQACLVDLSCTSTSVAAAVVGLPTVLNELDRTTTTRSELSAAVRRVDVAVG